MSIVTNVLQSLLDSARSKVPSHESQTFNSVYGKTANFPPDVVAALTTVNRCAANRLIAGQSQLHPEFFKEVLIFDRCQKVAMTCVFFLTKALSKVKGGEFALAVGEEFAFGSSARALKESDLGFPSVLTTVCDDKMFAIHAGPYALTALQLEAEVKAPNQNSDLLAKMFAARYDGQGALKYLQELLVLVHKTGDEISPPPGRTSHTAMDESGILDHAVLTLHDGVTDPYWGHPVSDCDKMREILKDYKSLVISSMSDLKTRVTTETQSHHFGPSTKARRDDGGFALGSFRAPLTEAQFVVAARGVVQHIKSNLSKTELGKTKVLSDIVDFVHLGQSTVARCKPGVYFDMKKDVHVMFPTDADRTTFWSWFYANVPNNSRFIQGVADANVTQQSLPPPTPPPPPPPPPASQGKGKGGRSGGKGNGGQGNGGRGNSGRGNGGRGSGQGAPAAKSTAEKNLAKKVAEKERLLKKEKAEKKQLQHSLESVLVGVNTLQQAFTGGSGQGPPQRPQQLLLTSGAGAVQPPSSAQGSLSGGVQLLNTGSVPPLMMHGGGGGMMHNGGGGGGMMHGGGGGGMMHNGNMMPNGGSGGVMHNGGMMPNGGNGGVMHNGGMMHNGVGGGMMHNSGGGGGFFSHSEHSDGGSEEN